MFCIAHEEKPNTCHISTQCSQSLGCEVHRLFQVALENALVGVYATSIDAAVEKVRATLQPGARAKVYYATFHPPVEVGKK